MEEVGKLGKNASNLAKYAASKTLAEKGIKLMIRIVIQNNLLTFSVKPHGSFTKQTKARLLGT